MKLPNKVTPYKKSVLAKFPLILLALQKENMTPVDLYRKIKRNVENVAEFTDILSALYALNKINFMDEEVLCYVEDNPM